MQENQSHLIKFYQSNDRAWLNRTHKPLPHTNTHEHTHSHCHPISQPWFTRYDWWRLNRQFYSILRKPLGKRVFEYANLKKYEQKKKQNHVTQMRVLIEGNQNEKIVYFKFSYRVRIVAINTFQVIIILTSLKKKRIMCHSWLSVIYRVFFSSLFVVVGVHKQAAFVICM